MRPNPALNGLRDIAILPVLALHAEPSKLPGGGLGVDLFFALSGYLITTSLPSEVAVSGSFSFRNFYARRVRRIWPALGLGVVLAVVLYAAQPVPPVGRGMTTAVLLTLTQFGNWFQSYGKADLGTLSHTWSLAV